MPAEMMVSGTARAFTRPTRDVVERRLHEMAQSYVALQGCKADVEVHWVNTPLVNHPAQADAAASSARAVVGAKPVSMEAPLITGGEDFASMLEAKPGAFVAIGNGTGPEGVAPAAHTPFFDFNDAVLPIGAASWVSLIFGSQSCAAQHDGMHELWIRLKSGLQ